MRLMNEGRPKQTRANKRPAGRASSSPSSTRLPINTFVPSLLCPSATIASATPHQPPHDIAHTELRHQLSWPSIRTTKFEFGVSIEGGASRRRKPSLSPSLRELSRCSQTTQHHRRARHEPETRAGVPFAGGATLTLTMIDSSPLGASERARHRQARAAKRPAPRAI